MFNKIHIRFQRFKAFG